MNSELFHYGVIGQKWGVRRYQNYDGTLTQMGKVRNKYYREQDQKSQPTDILSLYHGSSTKIVSELFPRVSFELIPAVYATTDRDYALIRAGKFPNGEILIREEHEIGKHSLAEVEPGAFDKVFNRTGYIYEVDAGKFKYNYGSEYISNHKADIKKTHEIKNVLKELKANPNIELISYENPGNYWDNVKGGRDGYIQRKQESIKAMNEAIAKAVSVKVDDIKH